MESSDDFRPLYRIMLGLGVVAVVILAVGVGTLVRFGPFGQHSGYRAHVTGIYPYNTHSGQVYGRPSTHFPRTQPFAAQVAWEQLPPGMVVAARWYDSIDSQVGGVGPAPAGQLAGYDSVVPAMTPASLHANLPGSYTLNILRYAGGQPVELIDTVSVAVLHDP